MKKFYCGSGSAGRVALFAAVFSVAGTAAQAQQVTQSQVIYQATFDSADIVSGAPATGFTPYSSPNTGVDHLDGQNNWGSSDPYSTSTTGNGGLQVNGGSDYVGNFGNFFGDTTGTSNFAAAIGGNQRNTAPTTALPDVVPSAASGGVVSLYHPLAVPAGAGFLTLDADLVLTSPVAFTSRDSFSFSLTNAANTASLITLNFTPAPPATGQPAADNVTTTVGTATNVTTGTALVLSSQYHLHLVVTSGAGAGYSVTFTDPASGGTLGTFSGSLGTSSITLANVANFSAGWTLANTTQSNGGYTGAGDNTLAFDNLFVAPEPSTYALMTLGLFGLFATCRSRRRQA